MADISSGTQAATIGTEHILHTESPSAGTIILKVDVSNLENGDDLILRGYDKVDGTNFKAEIPTHISNNQSDEIGVLVLVSFQDVKFTLEQTTGTGRSFPWRVLTP